jgi:tetratricopeptide (TPR) repeat protein
LISPAAGEPIFLSSHCDSVQATMLVELGRWSEAEAMLTRAKADFETVMRMPSWHPDIALADLRTRQGRLAEAESLLIGKDQAVEALLPAARLHLARGDSELAGAMARRGLRVLGADRVRAAELLTVLIDAEIARGDLDAAVAACSELTNRTADLDIAPLRARAAAARARVQAATGTLADAIATLEATVDFVDPSTLPWLRAIIHLDLARLHERAGDGQAASIDAMAATALLTALDVVIDGDDVALLERLTPRSGVARSGGRVAALAREGKWWTASCDGSSVRLHDSKGLRYLAELVARPGVERHALDLVDTVEGVAADGGPDRRALGDAGAVLDTRARTAYRQRIEQLRAEADEALDGGLLDTAEAKQAELDQLVVQLAQAFGLGGRDRRAASAAERSRLNVTRALRAALGKVAQALPDAGPVLDRRVRTGQYCAYEPDDNDEVLWIVQS